MDFDVKDLAGLAGVPVIQALVALIKTTIPDLPAQYYPSIAIVWGVALNLGLAYLLQSDLRIAAIVGAVAGLAASGLYTLGKQASKP